MMLQMATKTAKERRRQCEGMALSLLSQNTCNFSGCGQSYQNLYDLIAHIEFAHIPLIEEEQRQKASVVGDENRQVTASAPNLPLSFFQRVFPTPYRPNPITLQPVKLSFSHYRKRPPPVSNVNNVNATPIPVPPTPPIAFAVTPSHDGSESNHSVSEDMDECNASDPEIRFACPINNCGKRYKNSTALKLHQRSMHGIVDAPTDNLINRQAASIGPAEGAIPIPGQQPPVVQSPTKYAQSRPHKCSQCSKRYKTVQGLQNHVTASHQKLNGSQNPDNQPSPAALAQLIMQKTSQGQAVLQANNERNQAMQNQQAAQQQQQQQQRQQGMSTPTSMHPSQGYQQGSPVNVQTHLPVRSIQVQPNRIHPQSPHNPNQMTTGQLLTQQLMHQKRQQQMQQQHHQQQQHQQGQPQTVYLVPNEPPHRQLQHVHQQQSHVPQQQMPQEIGMRRYVPVQQQKSVPDAWDATPGGPSAGPVVPPVIEQASQ